MATAGNSTADEAVYEGGARAGVKFRKRPFRKHQTTPYDRPPTAHRIAQRYGWLSKVVDPASKLITYTANRIFGPVFRKPLLPSSHHSPGQIRNARDDQPELPLLENHSAVCEQGNRESQNPNNSFNSNGVTELEHMLKQMTFTRSQIDRLSAVLHSKAADDVLGDEKCEAKLEGPLVNCAKQKEVVSGSIEANGSLPLISPGMVSTPATGSRDLRDAAASPAELAKTYMFERSVKASTSIMGSQSQAHRGDIVALSDVPFHQGSPSLSLAPKARNKVGITDNVFRTPRPRGRSAIYRMARTPYSRVHSTTAYKGAGALFDPHNETNSSTSSQKAVENVHFNESKKLVLKRRSSVLESDMGAVGPIRRIRQKPNMGAGALFDPHNETNSSTSSQKAVENIHFNEPKKLVLKRRSSIFESDMGAVGPIRRIRQKPNLLFSRSLGVPALGASIVPQGKLAISDGREGKLRDHVSSRSIEMGKKILETLETLTPPKEKPSLEKLDVVEGGRPIEMTPSMLRGQALKSLEKVDSLEGFVSVQNGSKTANFAEPTSHHVLRSSYNRQDTGADKTAEMLLVSPNKSDTKHGDNGRFSNGNPLPNAKTVVSHASTVTLDAPKKRRAFHMSVHEDFLELDDDQQPNEMGSTSLNEGGEQQKNSFAEGNAPACLSSPDSGTILDKPEILSEPNLPSDNNSGPESTLLNKNSLESSSYNIIDERGDFTFPRSLGSSSAVSAGVKPAVAVPEVKNVALPKEAEAAPPVFSFGLKSSEKMSPIGFQSRSSAVEVSRSKNENLESSTSFADNTSAVFAVFKAPGADAKADNAAKEDVNLSKKSENGTTLLSGSISCTSPIGIMNTTGTPKNGSLGSVFGSSTASSPAVVSSGAQTLYNGICSLHPLLQRLRLLQSSTVAGASASFSTSSAMGSFPSFSAGSVFAFGSSGVTSTSNVSSTSVVKSSDPGSKTKDSAFANQTSSAGAPANVGSGLFSFSSTSLVGDDKLQTSNVGGPVFGVKAPAACTLFASATQNMPCHLPTSASIPAGGASVSSISSSGSSVFGSFAASSPALASSSGVSSTSSSSSSVFGSFAAPSPALLSSSDSSSLAQSVSSSSGTVSGIFGSSCQPAIVTSLVSGFNSSSQPAGFIFGASSGSASNSAPSQSSSFVFGASSGPASNSAQTQSTAFSFGVSSCFGSASNNAPMVFGSTGSSSGSVFSFTSAVSTPTPTPTINFSKAPASQPGFGSSSSAFAFGSPAPSGSNDQMHMEDSMAEDSVQASTPPVQVFGQPPMLQPSTTGFQFPTGGNPFQFGAQQSQMVSQNPSPFQPSSSLDFSAGTGGGGGSFSLGAGGTDKSNRKIVKVKKFRKK